MVEGRNSGEVDPALLELSEEQLEGADFVLDELGLGDYAGVEVEMYGQSADLRSGLARCWRHISDTPLEETEAMIRAKLRDQGAME